ncbi:MAG: ABC transporter substrate-binding protein [Gordonia sp. (in: high G+C Gram-positive bacteria)]|uniref:ABC transporter substrate-binding protein n=1 Tax=Gordonia sp. (in: high G+C Gram-positive bacteria) TaxID=84139 RepID=UPI003C792D78
MKTSPRFVRPMRAAGVALAAAAMLASGLTACSSDDSSSNSTGPTVELPDNPAKGSAIKIGFITPEGGAISLPEVRQAAEAATTYLNDNGDGIGGHKVDLVVCKEHEEAASATACANQMVEDKVTAVVSPFGSMGSLMIPIITGAGIPFIGQAPVSQPEMTSPNTYMLSGGVISVLGGQAEQAVKDGVKKFAIIVGDTGDAASQIGAMAKMQFAPRGIDVRVITIPASIADPTPNLTAALKDKPDAVTIMGDTRQCTTAIKALQTVAPDIKKYMISTCIDKPVTDAVGADAVAGSKAFTTVNLTDQTDESVKLYRSIMAKYAPEVDPNGIAYLGYQTLMSLAGVGGSLPQTDAPTSKDITTALTTAKNVPVPAAPGLTFTCNGKAAPMFPTVCNKELLVSTVSPDLQLVDTVIGNKG